MRKPAQGKEIDHDPLSHNGLFKQSDRQWNDYLDGRRNRECGTVCSRVQQVVQEISVTSRPVSAVKAKTAEPGIYATDVVTAVVPPTALADVYFKDDTGGENGCEFIAGLFRVFSLN
jgi:hypothetical protein